MLEWNDVEWNDTYDVQFDSTIRFGKGYDFFGLEHFREEAIGPNGNYVMWPSGGKYSLYRDTDGAVAFEKYATGEECKEAAERWCKEEIEDA